MKRRAYFFPMGKVLTVLRKKYRVLRDLLDE
jgi:hypothetical protein